MEGTLAAFFLFTEKLQTAVASAITGIILVAVGYDAELYKDATTIPAELFSGLGLVMFGLPALLGLIAVGIFYVKAANYTPEQLKARLTDDIAKWAAVIERAGIPKQ